MIVCATDRAHRSFETSYLNLFHGFLFTLLSTRFQGSKRRREALLDRTIFRPSTSTSERFPQSGEIGLGVPCRSNAHSRAVRLDRSSPR